MGGFQGSSINLGEHFKNLAEDWETEPLPPLWLPKKFLRNNVAHAFPYTGFIGVGTACTYVALCGWRPDDKISFRKSSAGSPPESFLKYMPDKNVCEPCKEYVSLYEQKMKVFSRMEKASEVRTGYQNSSLMKTKI